MKVTTLLFLFLNLSCFAQYNLGSNAFSGFEQTNTSKSLGVGSRYYALPNGDLSTTLDQAALLDTKMQGSMHSTIGILPSGVNFGVFSTALKTKIGCIAPYVRYLNYGNFNETNASGEAIGSFNALDYQLGASYAYTPNPYFRMGVQLNLLGSQLERYSAFGFSSTFSALLIHPKQLLTAAFGVRNLGFVFKNYTSTASAPLPISSRYLYCPKLQTCARPLPLSYCWPFLK
jgi:hypothetical protein